MGLNLERLFEPINAGEYELKKALREDGYIVKDVSNSAEYWEKDIDLIVTNMETEVVTTIEVKWDYCLHKTGNLFIETINSRSKGGNGWFNFCEAKLLAYGDAINKIFYFIDVAALKDYIEKNKNNLKTGYVADGAAGYLVPLDSINKLLVCAVQV